MRAAAAMMVMQRREATAAMWVVWCGEVTLMMQRCGAATATNPIRPGCGGLHGLMIERTGRGPPCAASSSSGLPRPPRTCAIVSTNTILVTAATDNQRVQCVDVCCASIAAIERLS